MTDNMVFTKVPTKRVSVALRVPVTDPWEMDVPTARTVLTSAYRIVLNDHAEELLRDLLENPTKSEPYDADRLFRLAMQEESYTLEAANVLYWAARLTLEANGIL